MARRHEHRGERQLEGRRQPLDDGGGDGLVGAERRSQIAADRSLQEGTVLDQERPIEAEPPAQIGDVLRRRAVAEHGLHRIAGHEVNEREHERRDAQQDGNGQQETANKKSNHGRCGCSLGR